MIIEVFITQQKSHNSLFQQRYQRLDNHALITQIGETIRDALHNTRDAFNFTNQQNTTITGKVDFGEDSFNQLIKLEKINFSALDRTEVVAIGFDRLFFRRFIDITQSCVVKKGQYERKFRIVIDLLIQE